MFAGDDLLSLSKLLAESSGQDPADQEHNSSTAAAAFFAPDLPKKGAKPVTVAAPIGRKGVGGAKPKQSSSSSKAIWSHDEVLFTRISPIAADLLTGCTAATVA